MGHFAGRAIVTDGIIFQVDAANKLCGNVTDAKNMVNPTELGSFVNGTLVVDNSYSFDGVNDYIVLSNTITNTIYTLDFWYKMGVNDGSYGYFVSSGANGFAISEGGTVVGLSYGEFYYYNGTVATRLGSSIPSLTEWNNITSIIDTSSNIIKVYGNGSLISNNSISNLSTSVTNIGRYITGNSHFLNGGIANVNIYNKALTQSEITQNYEVQKHRYL
jgi:hypothetical protein